jgi:hypothetical protein
MFYSLAHAIRLAVGLMKVDVQLNLQINVFLIILSFLKLEMLA